MKTVIAAIAGLAFLLAGCSIAGVDASLRYAAPLVEVCEDGTCVLKVGLFQLVATDTRIVQTPSGHTLADCRFHIPRWLPTPVRYLKYEDVPCRIFGIDTEGCRVLVTTYGEIVMRVH